MSLKKRDSLGQLCKGMEQDASTIHPADKAIYVRLDGRTFSRITKHCDRPFDDLLAQIMQNVAMGLVHDFHPDIAYVQSDEISLVFFPRHTEGFSHLFGGKQQKLTSVLASFATWSFLTNLVANRFSKIDISSPITFDCRTVSCTPDEALLHILWRHQDCTRNAIQSVCQFISKEYNREASWRDEKYNKWMDREGIKEWMSFRKSELEQENAAELILNHVMLSRVYDTHVTLYGVSVENQKKLIDHSGFPWDNLPGYLKYGSCFYKSSDGVIEELYVPKIYHTLRDAVSYHEVFETTKDDV